MSDELKKKAKIAKELFADAKAKALEGNFAYSLAASSIESHIDELSQIEASSNVSPAFEMLDFRLISNRLKTGSAPLDLVSKFSQEIRKTLGHAALRIMQGGMNKVRIPKAIYNELDLRLVGLLPGSSRFIISASANRDLFDDGLSKGAIERMFAVLDTAGEGPEFLSAVNILGPSSAKSLRGVLYLLRAYSAEAEFKWKYSGNEIRKWVGSKESINNVVSALEVTDIIEQEKVLLHGNIELLSKRERIELRLDDGALVKILYSKNILPQVSELHLEQEVNLYCQVTETENPLTNETSVFYELLEIKN